MAAGRAERLVVTVPSLETWPLPAYELAIMAAVELRSRGLDAPDVALVTPETQPLEVFGPAAARRRQEPAERRAASPSTPRARRSR